MLLESCGALDLGFSFEAVDVFAGCGFFWTLLANCVLRGAIEGIAIDYEPGRLTCERAPLSPSVLDFLAGVGDDVSSFLGRFISDDWVGAPFDGSLDGVLDGAFGGSFD